MVVATVDSVCDDIEDRLDLPVEPEPPLKLDSVPALSVASPLEGVAAIEPPVVVAVVANEVDDGRPVETSLFSASLVLVAEEAEPSAGLRVAPPHAATVASNEPKKTRRARVERCLIGYYVTPSLAATVRLRYLTEAEYHVARRAAVFVKERGAATRPADVRVVSTPERAPARSSARTARPVTVDEGHLGAYLGDI